MIRDHRDAFLALLADLDYAVHVSEAPAGAPLPYVVVHPGEAPPESLSYVGDADWRVWRYITACYAQTSDHALEMEEDVIAALLMAQPTVPDRDCERIERESIVPLDRDEDRQPTAFVTRDVWVYASVPA